MRVALVAALFACLGLVLATPASAVRSKRGAKPSITILTKDQRTALRTGKLSLRVGIGKPPARVRLRGLGLDLGPRPIRIVTERKLRFRRAHSRVYNLKLTKDARRLIQAARDACRDVRVSAFASSRRYGTKRDDQRTTLVRHSKTLKHGRKSGCTAPGTPGAPGVPGSPGSTPGLGGPGLEPPGTPPQQPPPVPTDPITIRAGAADGDATPPVGTPMFAYTDRSRAVPEEPPFDPENPAPPGIDPFLQFIGDPDENLYAKSFEPSNGIHTRIRSRAIVIESGGKKLALAQVDLGGHPLSFTQEVLKRVADLGITADRLFLSSTHTHSSSGAIWSADNMGYGLAGGDVFDPRVFDIVVRGVVDAIRTADSRLQPARVGIGTATLRGASRNRGHEAFKLNPDAPADEKADNNRAVDTQVTVIRVDDAKGAPLGAWSNFAIHPVSFGGDNLLFSGDNAATTERLVEEEMLRDAVAAGRTPAHRPVNVWTNGAEGDVSPNGGTESDATEPNGPHRQLEHSNSSFGSANSAGRKVSGGILAAWREAGRTMSGSPAIDARHTYMSLDPTKTTSEGSLAAYPVLGLGVLVDPIPPGFDQVWPAGSRPCAPTDNPPPAGPGQGNKFPGVAAPGGVPNVQPASLLRIGPLAVAAFPTEITTQAGRRIRNAVQAAAGANAPSGAILAGLTNSYNSYTATPDEYPYCHYEAGFTLWGKAQGSYYRDLAGQLAASLYTGAPAPVSAPEPPQVAPGTPNNPTGKPTPLAGDPVAQPADATRRLAKAVFRWNGGDPAIDAPRGRAFVTLEYDEDATGNDFVPVATEDSVVDTTQRDRTGVWTETWQFTECDAIGRYRFRVRGRAVKTGQEADYNVTSEPFTLQRAGIDVYSSKVENGVARVRAEYTGLPDNALTLLNRRVRHGFAVLRVTRPGGASEEVIAPIDSKRLEFTASVPAGASVSVVSVEDACGNTGS
jgi:neutral ceramidase